MDPWNNENKNLERNIYDILAILRRSVLVIFIPKYVLYYLVTVFIILFVDSKGMVERINDYVRPKYHSLKYSHHCRFLYLQLRMKHCQVCYISNLPGVISTP